jgi:hypothetical protein
MARFILSLLRELDENETCNDSDVEDGKTSGINFAMFANDKSEDMQMDIDDEFLFLAAELEEDEGEDFAFEKDDEEMEDDEMSDAGENEDIDDGSDAPSNHDEDNLEKRYPILFTSEQRGALRHLYCGLRDDQPRDALLVLFHQVSLAVFTTQRADAERSRFHLPIDTFIISFNIRKDGSIRKPVSIAPGVSVLQYWAQFSMLCDAMKSGSSIAEYETPLLLKHLTSINSYLTDHYLVTRDG